jgi:protein-tyrosine phosphatase
MKKITVLFVCMGNICRSPTAEGVFTQLVKEKNLAAHFVIDSAGTHAYHTGEAPDLRSQHAAKNRGIDMRHLRARQVVFGDFVDFDYLLVMDNDNYHTLQQTCPAEHKHKIRYFLDYAPQLKTKEVPDPYYGGKYGFETVLDMIEAAAVGFLTTLQTAGELT